MLKNINEIKSCVILFFLFNRFFLNKTKNFSYFINIFDFKRKDCFIIFCNFFCYDRLNLDNRIYIF